MSALAALLAQVLFLGQMPGTADVASQVAQALSAAGRGDKVLVAPDLSTALPMLTEGVPDHLILTATQGAAPAGPELAALQLAVKTLGSPSAYLLQGWPAGGVSQDWTGAIATAQPDWQAAAAGLGVPLLPVAPALGAVVAQAGPALVGTTSGPDDRAYYVAALVAVRALGLDVKAVPDRLVRRWMRRDSVVSPELAQLARSVVLALPEAAATVPPPVPAPDVAAPADAPPPVPGAPPGPAAPPVSGVTAPGIGFGLAGFSDWAVHQPFLDLMKSARPWVGHVNGRWGAVSFEDLRQGGHVDAQGWPLRLPPGGRGCRAWS